ncbi:MAG: hypothetical protein ABIR56_03575 [Polaromonas sp.]
MEALKTAGYTVTTADLRNADINGNLSTVDGRQSALTQTLERCGGRLDAWNFVPAWARRCSRRR